MKKENKNKKIKKQKNKTRSSQSAKKVTKSTKGTTRKVIKQNPVLVLLTSIKQWLLGVFIIPRMAVIVGLFFALLFYLVPQFWQKPPEPTPVIPSINPTIPLNITIDRLNLTLPIKEATVSANDWQVYDDAVSWLKGSGNLGGGNIVLYGHNSKTFFGKIIQLGVGDQIVVSGAARDKIYIVEKSYQTNRWDLSAITASDEQLTMYTCSGWFDANRWFVIAKPLNSEKT